MTRKLKALGVALFAVLALGTTMAAAAQAHEFTSSSGTNNTILEGKNFGLNKFTVAGVPIFCETAKFDGTVAGNEVDQVTVTPTHGSTTSPSGCEDAFGDEMIVHTNSCHYILDSDTNGEGHATVEIECDEPGDSITITVPALALEIHIPAQHLDPASGHQGVHYTNEPTTPKTVTLKSTVAGIEATCTGPFAGVLCEEEVNSEHFTTHLATYEGETTIKGYEDNGSKGKQVDITVE